MKFENWLREIRGFSEKQREISEKRVLEFKKTQNKKKEVLGFLSGLILKRSGSLTGQSGLMAGKNLIDNPVALEIHRDWLRVEVRGFGKTGRLVRIWISNIS